VDASQAADFAIDTTTLTPQTVVDRVVAFLQQPHAS
jgi:hypothetical protein